MVFSAISRFSSLEANNNTDDSVSGRREKAHIYASLRHIDAIRYRMKAEREKSYSKAD